MIANTHGPWDFAAGDMTVHANRLALAICRTIGGKQEAYSESQQDEAIHNFNLLQAAPELLTALQECCDWLGYMSNCAASDKCLIAAREVIARATAGGFHG